MKKYFNPSKETKEAAKRFIERIKNGTLKNPHKTIYESVDYDYPIEKAARSFDEFIKSGNKLSTWDKAAKSFSKLVGILIAILFLINLIYSISEMNLIQTIVSSLILYIVPYFLLWHFPKYIDGRSRNNTDH